MCGIFKCNRAGKYIGYYNSLSEAIYHNPNAQKDWFFTNGETMSVWMFDGLNWVDTNRAVSSLDFIDSPEDYEPVVIPGESKTYFYIATNAGTYTFIKFDGIQVEVASPSLISLNWNGISWSSIVSTLPNGAEDLGTVDFDFLNDFLGEKPLELNSGVYQFIVNDEIVDSTCLMRIVRKDNHDAVGEQSFYIGQEVYGFFTIESKSSLKLDSTQKAAYLFRRDYSSKTGAWSGWEQESTKEDISTLESKLISLDTYYANNLQMPGIELRFVPMEIDDASELYGGQESNKIKDCYIEFRITEGLDYIRLNKSNIYVCLARWKRINRQRNIGFFNCRHWSVVDDALKGVDRENSYPNPGSAENGRYRYDMHRSIFWSQSRITPVSLSDLTGSNYRGEWIRFPYSMEDIMRRYIYAKKKEKTGGSTYEDEWSIVSPYDFLQGSADDTVSMVSSGGHIRIKGGNAKSYVSLSFGIFLGRMDFEDGGNNQHWIKGHVIPFTGRMVISSNILMYQAILFGKNRFTG